MRGAGALAAGALAALAALLALAGGEDAPPVAAVSVARAAGPPDLATGFAAAPGRVVTVAHVLEGRGRPRVRVGGTDARVLRVDRTLDLAVLAVPGGRPALARRARPGLARLLVRRGGRTVALPALLRRRVTARLDGRSRPALELAAEVAPGDSGAPVLDAAGRVTGVVYARSRARPGTAYAVDAAALRRLVR